MFKFKSWKSVLAGSAILLFVATGCASFSSGGAQEEAPQAVTQVTLNISGSGGTVRVLTAVKSAFEADTPGYTLDILSGSGTGGGVRGTIDGSLDVAAMARPPKDEEAAQDILYTEFGHTGQAMFVHPSVGIANLTSAQAAAIFAGEATNWSDVGGPNVPIIVFVRDEGDSSTAALRGAIFGETPFPESTQVLTSQGDMQAAIEGTPGSVGFGTWPAVLAVGGDIEAPSLDSVAPGDGAYPITNPIGLGYLSDRQSDIQPLIDWLLSAQGQAALQEFDVITK